MKYHIVTLLCAALLFLAAGCGKPSATEQPVQGQTSASNFKPADQGEATKADAEPQQADQDMHVIDDPTLGLRFRLPDTWYQALYEQPCISPSGSMYGMALDYITKDAFAALNALFSGSAAEGSDERKELEATYAKGLIPLVAICAENPGERDDALRAQYTQEKILGTQGGTTYTLLTKPDADLSALSDAERERYQALLSATADFSADMTLSGKKVAFQDGAVAFASKTVDGKDIDTREAFAANKLTMINIWATWCGPCINELPELQKLSQNLPEGVQLLGICTDGEQEAALATEILKKTGVTYPNAVANADMLSGFLSGVQAFPTTIFVDAQGNIVGEPMPGVPSGDVVEGYRKAIDERLALLEAR